MNRLCIPILLLMALRLLPGNAPISLAKAPPREWLQIPSIGVDVPVVVAQYGRGTWNFSRITGQAAYLAMRPQPGQGSNVVIAAHFELVGRKPGPFYRLGEVMLNDEIIVTHKTAQHRYRVRNVYWVDPTNLGPIYQTGSEVLTLITCDDFNARTQAYDKRLIVRAAPVP